MKKVNKRKCRPYAAQPLKISKNNGVLRASRIKYIVKVAIRNIAHQRVLILYFYECERVLEGDMQPKWTIFQGRQDYTTLVRKKDGKTSWLTGSLERLTGHYSLGDYCCFHTLRDEDLITRFCNNGGNGFVALRWLQNGIMRKRAYINQCKKDRKVIERMNALPRAPRGLNGWMEKNVLPAYLFYNYRKGDKENVVYCTRCKKESIMTGVRHNTKGVCPNCKWPVVIKSRGKRGIIIDRETCSLVQKITDKEVVVRVFKLYARYNHSDKPEIHTSELIRYFVQYDAVEKCSIEPYYYESHDGLTPWLAGVRPNRCSWNYDFNADDTGTVYLPNLQTALQGTPWQYCAMWLFDPKYRHSFSVYRFLRGYLYHPKMEHLVKVGLYSLALALAYDRYNSCLEEKYNKTQQILNVEKQDLPFLKAADISMDRLALYQKYCAARLRDRQALMQWQIEHDLDKNLSEICKYVSVKKMIPYLDKQAPSYIHRISRYSWHPNYWNEAATEYEDYLRMADSLGYDMRNSFVMFPYDCHEAHDKAQKQIKMKQDKERRKAFESVYSAVQDSLDYERYGMKMLCPAAPEEVVAEGHALHHCVGSYVQRVAERKCLILFLRKTEEVEKPFYTVEVRGRRVIQIRGQNNQEETPEVRKFMKMWQRKVLDKVKLSEDELPQAA